MSDRLDLFLEYAEETEVHFFEYVRTRSVDGKSKVVMVLEGKDDPKFYTPKFDALIKSEWVLLSVGGKSKALSLRGKIRSHPKYNRDSVYFFVDRDYDNNVAFEDTYVTPAYSIENLYCNPETVRRLVEVECGLTKVDLKSRREILAFLMGEYLKLRSRFHSNRKLVFLNSVFCYVRTQKQDRKISLDKLLKLEVKLKDGELVLLMKKGDAFAEHRAAERDSYKDFVRSNVSWLEVLSDPALRFRGKQEILILRLYVNALKHDGILAEEAKRAFGVKVKTENPSMADHILSTASQYVRTPACLSGFLSAI